MTRPLRPALLLSFACISSLVLTAPAGAADIFGRRKPAPAPAYVAPPPPAPVLPTVTLSGQVVQAAGAYRAYMRKAASITAGFTDGASVETSLEKAEAADPLALSRGVVAYSAVLALQEPAFVTGVQSFAGDPGQRRIVTERIVSDPAYAARLPGAAAAAAMISSALNADGTKVAAAGAAVKQAAYDVQRQKWSKADVPDRPGRLARAKTLSAAPMSATPEEIADLQAAVAPATRGQTRLVDVAFTGGSTPVITPTMARGMAIAALAVLGAAAEDNDAVVQTILNDASGSFCHNMAKLNLYQCLAVAKPFYEDVFCLGQHVLIDTGQCLVKGSGAPPLAAASLASAKVTATASGASTVLGAR